MTTNQHTTPTGAMMAPQVTCGPLIQMLAAYERVIREKPDRTQRAGSVIADALEVALVAHRRGGCPPAKLTELEKINGRMVQLLEA